MAERYNLRQLGSGRPRQAALGPFTLSLRESRAIWPVAGSPTRTLPRILHGSMLCQNPISVCHWLCQCSSNSGRRALAEPVAHTETVN